MKAGAFSSPALAADISRVAGKEIIQIRPFAAGQGADIFLADLRDGSRVVVKRAREAHVQLETEGWMLRTLKELADLPVPEVHCAERHLLVLDYVQDCARISPTVEEDAARHIARLHAVKGAHYGLDRDTMIGALWQRNAESDDWAAFFGEYRLMAAAREGLDEGSLPVQLVRQIDKVAGRLREWLDEPAAPALIHGDLWSGNILTGSRAVNAFIDPALYYADPEVELAFIALFSTFGERFFRHYGEVHPMRPGFFEVRRDVYNLYPLLVHARIFGGAYIEKIMQVTGRLVG
jgi:fructosamine-3-kinase